MTRSVNFYRVIHVLKTVFTLVSGLSDHKFYISLHKPWICNCQKRSVYVFSKDKKNIHTKICLLAGLKLYVCILTLYITCSVVIKTKYHESSKKRVHTEKRCTVKRYNKANCLHCIMLPYTGVYHANDCSSETTLGDLWIT